jgi:uncharacterized protein YjiS (DUF1127 family)
MNRSNTANQMQAKALCFDIARAGWHVLWLRFARQRSRRILAELDERMLRDVGITRADAMQEAVKPFWSD